MSAVDDSGEAWKPFLMRSSTPGPNEKVLNWVETMSREGVDTTPPASLFEHEESRTRTTSQRGNSVAGLFSPTKSHRSELRNVPEAEAEDVDSNTQERSDAGETETPVHEPGPQDPPGPRAKYESQDTAPSFGNKGPMPVEDISFTNPYAPTWQPNWAAQSPTVTPRNGVTSPSNGAAHVALPASTIGPSRVMSPLGSVNIQVESPSQSTKSRTRSQAPTASQQAPSERARSPPTSPRPASRTGTAQPPQEEPWSPKSQAKSRLTAKSPTGSHYPPLPSTRNGDDWDAPLSPKSQAYSKAPSVSPSDSLSQFKPRKEKSTNGTARTPVPASVMSGGNHQNRPFSPYRHAPTNEDLLHAATRGRGLVIPEESERAPSVVESKRSKAPSAAPSAASRHTKQPSEVSQARSKQPTVITQHTHPSHSPSKAPSKAKSPISPADDLNPEEARMVQDVLSNNHHDHDGTPRTSYYAASVLEPDVVNSHFHDNDLCVLLHQESDPTVHEVVKRALRKAIRQRVKKLGMKADNESIREYKRAHTHEEEPASGEFGNEEPPKWATDIKRELVLMQQRIESLGPKIENLRPASPGSYNGDSRYDHAYEGDETRTPMTQTVNIHTQPGTLADSMYQPPESELVVDEEPVNDFDEADRDFNHTPTPRQPYPGSANHEYGSDGQRDDSPGQMFLEEELYKLRQKPSSDVHSPLSQASWDVKPAGEPDDEHD